MKQLIYLLAFLFVAACNPAQKAADDFLSQVSTGEIILLEGFSITTWDVFNESLIDHSLIEEGLKPTHDLRQSLRDYYLSLPMSINSFELISSSSEEKYLWRFRDVGNPEYWKMFKQTKAEYIESTSDLYDDQHNFAVDLVHDQIIFQELVPLFTFDYKVTTSSINYKVVVKVVKTKDSLSGKIKYKVAKINSIPI